MPDVLGATSHRVSTAGGCKASDNAASSQMDYDERQKAVSAVFMVIYTLCIWAEHETEERHRVSRGGAPSSSRRLCSSKGSESSTSWPSDESIVQIALLQGPQSFGKQKHQGDFFQEYEAQMGTNQ
eukprot:4622479-Ditylum_brightwellii.AAC.1